MDINKEQTDKKVNIDEYMHDQTHAHTHAHTHEHPHGHTHEHPHEHNHEHGEEHNHEHGEEHNYEHGEEHNYEHGEEHNYEHGEEQNHDHTHEHVHQNTKAVINRLSRAIGHLESVKKMVEDGRDCSDVLIQLAAVRSALNNTGKVILKDHIEHCIVEAIEEKDWATIEKMNQAIDQFMK